VNAWGVIGWKNAGKTTLVERLVAEIAARGLSVSTLKRTHHGVDLDPPGTDSRRHREAGAREVMLASAARWTLMHEVRDAPEPPLDELLARLAPVDIVIAEGWKRGPLPKLEVHDPASGRPLMAPEDPMIRAIAADAPVETDRPVFHRDDIPAMAGFILHELSLA
jgi:molybdopterin-guanine dinucleotide biosynthesis protein MobB